MKTAFSLSIFLKNGLVIFFCCLIAVPGMAQGSSRVHPTIPLRDTTHLIVWIKPGASPAKFKVWLQNFTRMYGATSVQNYCSNCPDTSLMLLKGKGPENFVSGQTVSGGDGGKKNGSSGGNDTAYWSINFPVDFTDTLSTKGASVVIPVYIKPVNSLVTVAVFDTGIDTIMNPPLVNYLYRSNAVSCFGKAAGAGWNFTSIPYNNNWKDDNLGDSRQQYPTLHGTVVSSFIMAQGQEYKTKINILPVKIHDQVGKSDLFKVLCGLAYAANRGANIINASFGYYASRTKDSAAILLKEFIKYYLDSNKHILMVAAAGNRDNANERNVYSSGDPVQMRNLDNVAFYPASLAEELRNVIAVTTVWESKIQNTVSPAQNFSNRVVDIGVKADGVNTQQAYFFRHPYLSSPAVVQGSSFATPIVTGKIAANYNLIEKLLSSAYGYQKGQIIEILLKNNLVHYNNWLTPFIKKGMIMIK